MSHETSNHTHCPDCALGAFTRNHYFTGKLLVERDFTDEQRFHIDKLRHHHQRLHGWGVVCGLKVKQHPNPTCRDRYVIVEPGTAIDCCGHEIIVREEVMFPFADDPDLKALKESEVQPLPHRLQICISYKECPTEQIPVLFDECGCDETRCAPNRILETFELDVIFDPPEDPAQKPPEPHLKLVHTIEPLFPAHVALHDSTRTLYVMTSNDPALIQAVNIDSNAVAPTPHTLTGPGLALAVSGDGKLLYAAVQKTATDVDVLVLDAANPGPGALIQTLTVAGVGIGEVWLSIAPAPDGRLFALFGNSGQINIWKTDINSSGGPPAAPDIVNLSAAMRGLVFSTDGKRAFVADAAGHKIRTIDAAATPTAGPEITFDLVAEPTVLIVAHSPTGDVLVAGDEKNKKLYFVPLDIASPVTSSVTLPNPPMALAASPSGDWIYLLERDGATPEKFFLQPVNAAGAQQNLSTALGQLFPLAKGSIEIALAASGTTFYVPFASDSVTSQTPGGIAILTGDSKDCADLLWEGLDHCPSCDTGNCVVLATVKDYHVGDKLTDQTDPPADPNADLAAQIARIDNRTGRRLLPSTQVLTKVVQCLLEHSPGGGTPGPAGPAGPDGPKGADGPQGPQGPPGMGLNLDLPHIVAINWPHNGFVDPAVELISKVGLIVAFDKEVLAETIRDSKKPANQGGLPVFEVYRRLSKSTEKGLRCFCSLEGEVTPVRVITRNGETLPLCGDEILGVKKVTGDERATGAVFSSVFGQTGLPNVSGDYRVIVRGDFILGAKQIQLPNNQFVNPALDADHLGPGLPNRCPTGDGVEGGTFESWFSIP